MKKLSAVIEVRARVMTIRCLLYLKMTRAIATSTNHQKRDVVVEGYEADPKKAVVIDAFDLHHLDLDQQVENLHCHLDLVDEEKKKKNKEGRDEKTTMGLEVQVQIKAATVVVPAVKV